VDNSEERFIEDESGIDSASEEGSSGEDGSGDDVLEETGSGNAEEGSGMGSGSGIGMFGLFLTRISFAF